MRITTLVKPGAMTIPMLASLVFINLAAADTISFSGLVTQSTSDGTGPAVNNPSLNSVTDGDHYVVTLDFGGSINAPGTFSLAGATLALVDDTASPPVSESNFDSVSLSVVPDTGNFDLSMLGCLSTGSGCLIGNELAVNFSIPAIGLNGQNITAQTIFGLSPALDLLEDDGVTDIQGTVNSYSYTGAVSSTVPEPAAIVPMCFVLVLLAWRHGCRLKRAVLERMVALLLAALTLIPKNASAADGQILINQATVMAAGGFPYNINQPGSYKLSGNLTVPDANTIAIQVNVQDVSIDLNGFSIIGPCGTSVSCGLHTGGIGVFSSADNTSVVNGEIKGMGSAGVELAGNGRVERIRAVSNGRFGIVVGHSGIISSCITLLNGFDGILASDGQFTGNVANSNGTHGLLLEVRLLSSTIRQITMERVAFPTTQEEQAASTRVTRP